VTRSATPDTVSAAAPPPARRRGGQPPKPPTDDWRRPEYLLIRHDDLDDRVHIGPFDRLPADEVLVALPSLPAWGLAGSGPRRRRRGAASILDWLASHPGTGWQERWQAANADTDVTWLDRITDGDPRSAKVRREVIVAGLNGLLLCRVVLPSYEFLGNFQTAGLLGRARQALCPDRFAALASAGTERGLPPRAIEPGLRALSKIVLRCVTNAEGGLM
jgi:hypothetical protein